MKQQQVTYEEINAAMLSVDWKALEVNELVPPSRSELAQKFVKAWAGFRLLAVALTNLPWFPAAVRAGAQVFISVADALAAAEGDGATPPPDFKAGKDL